MRILVAPDRFSGNLTAVEAASALRTGWLQAAAEDVVTTVPMSDGAAGLLDVVVAARGGRLDPVTVPGPLGADVPAAVLHVPGAGGGTAYVDAGQAIGAHLVPAAERRRAAERGSSAGLGHLLAAALRTGASRVVVGLGGAAVHDAGAGALAALAGTANATTATAGPLNAGGLALAALTAAETEILAAVRAAFARVDLVLAVADDAPLLGLHGAGAVLGQDPAVGPVAAQELERALGHATNLFERRAAALPRLRPDLSLASSAPGRATPGHGHAPSISSPLLAAVGAAAAAEAGPARISRRAGSGAGGGAAFMLQLLGGRVLAGADVVADAVGLREQVARADLVVTGGQVLDSRTLTDSVPATVSRLAMERGLPVVAVAEEVQTSRHEVAELGISATYEVLDRRRDGSPRPGEPARAWDRLAARGARIARTWSA